MTKDELVKRLKEIKIISRQKVTLRSGEESDFYCDIKKSFGYPDILNGIVDEIGKKIPSGVNCVAASGYGGLPLGSVLSSRIGLNFISVRSQEKNHGKEGLISGYIPNSNDRVVIIDDVLTSGSSIRETLKVLEDAGVKNVSAIVVVKRGEPKIPIPYSFVFDINEIFDN